MANVNGVQEEKSARFKMVTESQKIGQGFEQTMTYYKDWVKTYEEDLKVVGYQAPQLASDYLAKQGLPKDAYIFDTACGTGWVPVLMKKDHGYSNFDGLDASQDMLDMAKQRNVYKNIYCQKIGEGNKIPIPDNTYDATTMAGGLVAGHIKLDAFEELIRVTKPGGYIVISMREENRRKVPEYMDIDNTFDRYEKQGLWQKTEEAVTKKYYMDLDGLVYVYKITKKA